MRFDGRTKNFVLVLLATVTFIATYYLMMPVISSHMLNLGFDNFTIGLVVGLFSISSLVARPVSGIIIERIGNRKLMLVSILIFFLTPVIYKINVGYSGLCAAQVVYGFTIGTFTVASHTCTAELSNSETIAQYMGLNSIAFMLAKGMAPAAGIRVMGSYGFSAAVISTMVLAAVAVIFAFQLTDDHIGVKQKENSGFLKVLMNEDVYVPTIVLFCGIITFGAISAMLPVFAEERGINGIEYFFLINTGVVVLSRIIMGSFINKHLESLVSFSLILLTLSFLMMSFVDSFRTLVLVAVVYGIGFAMFFPILSSIMVMNIAGVPKGMALGIFTAGFDVGVAVGAVMGGFSNFISFRLLYIFLSLIPLAGFFIYQYVYIPKIHKESYNLTQNIT